MKETESDEGEFKPLALNSPSNSFDEDANESHQLPTIDTMIKSEGDEEIKTNSQQETIDNNNNNEQQVYAHYFQPQSEIVIDHKAEAIKGNFMPSLVLLEQHKIDVNESIDDNGNTLLHLSAKFCYLNVVRALIELFQGDINCKNKHGQSPLHVVCNNKLRDNHYLSYIIQIKDIVIDVEDNYGYTPLTYAIINHFHSAFYTLIAYKSDIRKIDKEGNSLIYHAIINDNLIALKFLLSNGKPLESSLNTKKLSDVLIASKGERCCKYLLKYYNEEKLSNKKYDNLDSCNLPLQRFTNGYNLQNYQMINAVNKYFNTNIVASLGFTLFAKKMKEFKLYNFVLLFVHKFMNKIPKEFKIILVFAYSVLSCLLFSFLYLYLSKSKIRLSFDLLFALYQLSTIAFIIYSSYRLFITHIPERISDFYLAPKDIEDTSNIIFTTKDKMLHNIFELPTEHEGCPICLITKDKTTIHCNRCNKCVKNFYFHSHILDICISKANLSHYMILVSCIWFIHFSLIGQLVNVISPASLSEYTFANVYYFISKVGIIGLMLVLYLLISGILLFGLTCELIVCKGCDVSYYLMFNAHKIAYGVIEQRGNSDVCIAKANAVSMREFMRNLFC